MSLNPGGANNYGWNYSKPDKPGYSTILIGTVLAIQEVQKMGFTMNGQPGAPQFWPDRNPVMNIRLAVATKEGELKTFTFQPAGKQARMGQKKSVHMDLFALTGNTDMTNLIGKTICIQTQEGKYGQGNPRPWYVSLVDAGPFQLNMPLPPEFKAAQVLANSAVSGGQVNAPQAPQQYQQQGYGGYQQQPVMQQPMQQGYGMQQQYQPQPYQPQPVMQQPQPMPAPQSMMQQPYQPQPMQAQPVQAQPVMQQPQPMPAPQPQPIQPSYPAGMDPAIAQAMASEVFGEGVQVTTEPTQATGDPVGAGQVYDQGVYDEDMLF